MAIVQKDAVLQIRLPADLLDKYKQLCAERLMPVSAKLRDHILREVEAWERANERRSGGFAKAAEPPSPQPAASPSPESGKAIADAVAEALSAAQRKACRKLTRSEKQQIEWDVRKRLRDEA